MSANDLLPRSTGWWGKLPSRGDFVGRGLPRRGQQAWDGWLQHGLAAAQQQLGAEALRERLLSMPPWHFAVLPRGGRSALWCGVILPSQDRVGRAFPLLLAEAYATDAMLRSDVSVLRARARQLARLPDAPSAPPTPQELEVRLAALAATPAPATETGEKREHCSLQQLRSKWPAAASFWWCVEPASDPQYPYAEPWPPQGEMLFDLLGLAQG